MKRIVLALLMLSILPAQAGSWNPNSSNACSGNQPVSYFTNSLANILTQSQILSKALAKLLKDKNQ